MCLLNYEKTLVNILYAILKTMPYVMDYDTFTAQEPKTQSYLGRLDDCTVDDEEECEEE